MREAERYMYPLIEVCFVPPCRLNLCVYVCVCALFPQTLYTLAHAGSSVFEMIRAFEKASGKEVKHKVSK